MSKKTSGEKKEEYQQVMNQVIKNTIYVYIEFNLISMCRLVHYHWEYK